MATEKKAFGGETADQVRTAILESTPAAPKTLKGNLNPGLNDLIMKALAKSPDQRYQSGQELVRDLEQCNAATKKTTTVAPKAQAAAAGAAPGTGAKPNPFAKAAPSPAASAAAPAAEKGPKPSFNVDPMMAEDDEGTPAAAARKSFSDLEELPPLKDIFVPSINPEAPSAVEEPAVLPPQAAAKKKDDKPKVQVREAAQKAVSEIRNTPPQLFLYAVGAAVALVGIIIAVLMLRNFFADYDSGPSTVASAPASAGKHKSPKQAAPAPPPQQASPAPQQAQPEITPPPPIEEQQPEPVVTEQPEKPARAVKNKGRVRVATTPQLAALMVSSVPAGAQISFDGSPLCQSPCTLTDIAPGQHTVSASKSGFTSESRTIALKPGASSSLNIQLGSLAATISVSSNPAGAAVILDGKDTGRLTPAVFTVSKPGIHTVVVRRNGYLEASNSVNAQLGQSANVNATLTLMGQTDDIRSAGGKFKKVFGHGGQSASMGIVSVKTQPKGAQIMVNNRVLDKTSPFDFYLNPGTYVIDVNMSGYKGVHRVINVEEGEKVQIEETLQAQ